MTVAANKLRDLSQSIREQQGQVRALEFERTKLIRAALGEGWTHARISEATGLSRGRINQLRLR